MKLEQELAGFKQQTQDPDSLELQKTRGGKGKRLTLQSHIALAIRRNMGNCATADVGAMLLEDFSRFTVSRAESKTGSALIASTRLFFHSMFQDLASTNMGSFKLAIHSYIQDATNSGILKGSKLAALILRSAYLKQQLPEDDMNTTDANIGVGMEFNFDQWFDSITRVADILPVIGSDSSVTAAQTLKHLEGLGCFTWKDVEKHKELQPLRLCFVSF